MKKFSWHTTDKKDKYNRYIGAEIIVPEKPFEQCAFQKCYKNYKPNRKGGHTHNHKKNVENIKYYKSEECLIPK